MRKFVNASNHPIAGLASNWSVAQIMAAFDIAFENGLVAMREEAEEAAADLQGSAQEYYMATKRVTAAEAALAEAESEAAEQGIIEHPTLDALKKAKDEAAVAKEKAEIAYNADRARLSWLVDVKVPANVDPKYPLEGVKAIATDLVEHIKAMDPAAVMVQTEYSLTYTTVDLLKDAGIPTYLATTQRKVEVDGDKKTVYFEFVRFRPYF